MKKQNAIQKELAKLDEQWEDFVDSELPIFHWLFAPDDIQLGLTFIKIKEQIDEENPELFIHLHTDFDNANDFGTDLANDMNKAIEEGIADAILSDEAENNPSDVNFTWQQPDLRYCQTGFNSFFRSCKTAIDAFDDYVHNIVIVITPSGIENRTEYLQWWSECCDIHEKFDWPKNLKLVMFDTNSQSEFVRLAKTHPKHIHSATAPVNTQQAINAILKDADDGSAGAKFRQSSVDLQQAIGKQDRPAMEKISSAAIEIAKHENWFDMWSVVLLTRAAGYLSMQLFEHALLDYRTAQTIASQGEQNTMPGCDKLHLQAKVCEGTCLFSMDRLQEAAQAYSQAAVMAEKQNDAFMHLENWRMASFCMERLKDDRTAWECGMKALAVGRTMEAPQRTQSTLPFLGQALLRISPSSQVRDQIKVTFTELLGENWLEQVEQVA